MEENDNTQVIQNINLNPFKEQAKLQIIRENLESELNIASEYKGKFSLDSLMKMKQEEDKKQDTSFKKDSRTKAQQEYGQMRGEQIAEANKLLKTYHKSGIDNVVKYIPIANTYSKKGQSDLLEQSGNKKEARVMNTAAGLSAVGDLLTLGLGVKYPVPTTFSIVGSTVGGNIGRIVRGNEGESIGSFIGGIGGATLPGIYNLGEQILLRRAFNKELNRAASNIKPPIIDVKPITITHTQNIPKQDNLLTLKNASDINRIASIKSNISKSEKLGIPKGERNQRIIEREWVGPSSNEWRNSPNTPVGEIQLSDDLSDIAVPFNEYSPYDEINVTSGLLFNPIKFSEFAGTSEYDEVFKKLGNQLTYVHPSISAKGPLNENPMIWDYRRYLLSQGIPSGNISTETLEKILSQQYQDLTDTMTGKAKGLVLWHGSPNWFDKFDYANYVGTVANNTGNAGVGTYFSRGRQPYGLSDQLGYAGDEQYRDLVSSQLNWNIQPYLITNIKSMPHYNDIQHISGNETSLSREVVSKLKPNNQLVINTFGGMRHPTLQPTKIKTKSNSGDQMEFRLRRDTGIKSLFPHPSTFIKNDDGSISIIRDWNDPRINYAVDPSLDIDNPFLTINYNRIKDDVDLFRQRLTTPGNKTGLTGEEQMEQNLTKLATTKPKTSEQTSLANRWRRFVRQPQDKRTKTNFKETFSPEEEKQLWDLYSKGYLNAYAGEVESLLDITPASPFKWNVEGANPSVRLLYENPVHKGISKYPVVKSHEVHHLAYTPTEPIPDGIIDPTKIKESTYDYLTHSNGTEVAARGNQFKNFLGFKNPDQKITKKDWEYLKKHYIEETGFDNNISDLFNAVDENKLDEFLKWLNKHSFTIGVLGTGTYKLNQHESKKLGGKIN